MAKDYDYGQLLDDFELGADVMPGESLTDYIERRRREFESKANGGSIGIEVLFQPKRGEYQTGGISMGTNYSGTSNPLATYKRQGYKPQTSKRNIDSRATAQDYANALKNVSAGTTYQQQADSKRYARQEANRMLTDAFRSGNQQGLQNLYNQFGFNATAPGSQLFSRGTTSGTLNQITGLSAANRDRVLDQMAQRMLSYPTGGSSAPPKKSPLQLKIEENQRIYNEYIKNNAPQIGLLPGSQGGTPTIPKPEYEQQALLDKLTMLTPEEALAGEQFGMLNDLDQYNFAQAFSQFKPQLRDPTYVSPYGTPDGRQTFGRRYGIKDGGRVGLFMGGPALEGQALNIYESMNAYGFSDQEIANALEGQGLYTPPGSSTPETTAPNIINQQLQTGGGGDNNFGGQGIGAFGNLDPNTKQTMQVEVADGKGGVEIKEVDTYLDAGGMRKTLDNKNPVNAGIDVKPLAVGIFESLFGKKTDDEFDPAGKIYGTFNNPNYKDLSFFGKIKADYSRQKELKQLQKEFELQEQLKKQIAKEEADRAAQYGATNYGQGAGGQSYSNMGTQGFGVAAGGMGGPVSNRTGSGRTDYSKGGLATMFTRRR